MQNGAPQLGNSMQVSFMHEKHTQLMIRLLHLLCIMTKEQDSSKGPNSVSAAEQPSDGPGTTRRAQVIARSSDVGIERYPSSAVLNANPDTQVIGHTASSRHVLTMDISAYTGQADGQSDPQSHFSAQRTPDVEQ
jgi:hypothetical protein